jgi:peptide/nickel transport system permease protein
MVKYVISRLLLLIPIILGVSFIVFSILSLTPSDPGSIILGMNAEQEAIDELNRQLGFDKPFLVRYADYVANAVTRFDFGKSYITQKPVFQEIASRFPNTLLIAFAGVALSGMIGIPIGIYSAVRQYSIGDAIASVSAMFLAAVPGFWLGMTFMLIFSLWLGLLPASGANTWKHFIMPVFTMALPAAAQMLRLTRSTMLETIRQDYIRTARAKGASERRVIFRHALTNALLPIITMLGINFGTQLSGAIIVESVFSIPGIGTLVVSSIRMKDIPQVMAATLFLATLFCLIILFVDLLYAFIDPRIRAKYAKARA